MELSLAKLPNSSEKPFSRESRVSRAYEGLLRHYQIRGQKAQAGQANENGDVEQRHYRFKQAVDQALMLRGSREFPNVAAYQLFLNKLFAHLNAGRQERYVRKWPGCGPYRNNDWRQRAENG